MRHVLPQRLRDRGLLGQRQEGEHGAVGMPGEQLLEPGGKADDLPGALLHGSPRTVRAQTSTQRALALTD